MAASGMVSKKDGGAECFAEGNYEENLRWTIRLPALTRTGRMAQDFTCVHEIDKERLC